MVSVGTHSVLAEGQANTWRLDFVAKLDIHGEEVQAKSMIVYKQRVCKYESFLTLHCNLGETIWLFMRSWPTQKAAPTNKNVSCTSYDSVYDAASCTTIRNCPNLMYHLRDLHGFASSPHIVLFSHSRNVCKITIVSLILYVGLQKGSSLVQ